MRVHSVAYVAMLAIGALLVGCGHAPAGAKQIAGPETFLKVGVDAANPGGFNEVTNPGEGMTMLVPPGFEWDTPETYFAAMNTANPSVKGGMAARSLSPIAVFDADVARLQRCLCPARIEVERMPHWSIEAAEKDAEKGAASGWVAEGRLNTALGQVPIYERTIEMTDPLGAKAKVVQRRYFMCWQEDSLAVFTYCPATQLLELGDALEQAALTLRPIKVDRNAQIVIPPSSPKRSRFGTDAELLQEEARARRDQDTIDQVNEINRENAERQRLQREQGKQDAGNQDGQGTPQDTAPQAGGSGGSGGTGDAGSSGAP